MSKEKKPKAAAEEKVIKIQCTSDQYMSFADMIPFADNPRDITPLGLQKLKKSILELGIFKPFLIWKQGNQIIGGNQRYACLLYLVENEGYTCPKLPVTILDVPEGIARTIVLRDNQSDGDWAYEQLSTYLSELEGFGIDKELSGFSDREMTDLQKLSQNSEQLRASLEREAEGQDINQMLQKKFGVSFKVPEADWPFFQQAMKEIQVETKTDDVWVNFSFALEKLYPAAKLAEQDNSVEGFEDEPEDAGDFGDDLPPMQDDLGVI